MRHFEHLTPALGDSLFARPPEPIDRAGDRQTLATALGATLYTPGTRIDYAERLPRLARQGLTSSVLCLEDAIADADVERGERNVVAQLRALRQSGREHPLVFVRVRRPDQVLALTMRLGDAARALSGFVFPKFTAARGRDYLDALAQARAASGLALYAMPVLESPEVMHAETRVGELVRVRALLRERLDSVLAVRIGATDLCGLFGLRRGPDLTVYDIAVVRAAIADIVNVFGRDDDLTITGPVWEHFAGPARNPWAGAVDAFSREVALDKATGIVGKTVIHPSHVPLVHAHYVVTAEEFADARAIAQAPGGGVRRSPYANKMIEPRPHARWARVTLRRARVYGVLAPRYEGADLLADVTA